MITILVAHQRRLVRQAIIKFLSSQDELAVVGDAVNGADVLKKMDKLKPDVIVVDSVLPNLGGLIDKTAHVGTPEVVVVPARAFRDKSRSVRHLTYDDSLSDLAKAVLIAGGGGTNGSNGNNGHKKSLSELTPREQQILTLIAEGLSNKQISQQMKITERTVKYHISNVLRKLELFSRTEAAVFYLRGGWAQG